MRKSIVLAMVLLSLSSIVGCSHQEALGNELIREQTTEFSYEQKIEEYLNSTVEEIVELTGDDIDADGTQTVFEPNVFYPCIFLKDEPFAVICRSVDKSLTPIYISFYENEAILDMLNLKENMEFSDIMDKLGEVPVEPSGNASQNTGGNTIYKIEYTKKGLIYVFCSYDKSGKDFDLYIGLQN